MKQIPTLTTERLILRAWREDDAPALAAIHGDPLVSRYIGVTGDPMPTLSQAWDHIALHTGHWALKGYGKWAAIERSTNRLIGRIGYFHAPYDWPGLELGWTLSRDCWGRGYATEGALAALDWGFETLPASEIISAIHPDNSASMRVAERVGEKRWREDKAHNKPCIVYGITRDEWSARKAR